MGNIDHPEHDELTYAIIGAAYEVRKIKGIGLLELPYHGFLCHELSIRGLEVMTYLRESGLRTGLLLNFNAMPFSKGIRRISL